MPETLAALNPASFPPNPAGLAALEARLQDDLNALNWFSAAPWTASCVQQSPALGDTQKLHDVLIVGGGQAGLALSAALAQNGIAAVLLDQAEADFEGPWATTARMQTLRSPKELLGPALGLPSLTFRAWFIAQWGADAWQALDKIDRLHWMQYLRWYRRVMRCDVRNRRRVSGVELQTDGSVAVQVVQMQTPHAPPQTWRTRHLVLATGRDGLGGRSVPDFMQGIDARFWAHSGDALDYTQLAGQHIGVIGVGSSAMDCAATALECGAASVDLIARRATLARVNKSKAAGLPGLTHGHYTLAAAQKWRLRHYIDSQQVPPPHGSTLRVSRHANAYFHFDCAVQAVAQQGNALHVQTKQGTFVFDFLLLATGFAVDWAQRPEWAAIAPHVRCWADAFAPPAGQHSADLAAHPWLGAAFEFQARDPDFPHRAALEHIHCFCYPAVLSHGAVSGDIPNISDGAGTLARAIASALYREDCDWHFARLQAFAEPEIDGSEWQAADTAARIRALQKKGVSSP